jgi:hypothetical protein
MRQKRKSRFADYEPASKRAAKKYVNPDGTPMTEIQIIAQKAMEKIKKITTR